MANDVGERLLKDAKDCRRTRAFDIHQWIKFFFTVKINFAAVGIKVRFNGRS